MKSCRWVSYTFLQERCFLKVFQHFRIKFVPTSLTKHLNVRVLLANAVKSGRWVSHIFLRPCFLKFFSILEENCGTNIINGTFKCRLLLANALKSGRWVSYTFLQKPSLFNLFWIRASFWRNFFVCKINDFVEINIWRSWWHRNLMRKKIHLLFKQWRTRLSFHFFLSNLMVLIFKRSIFDFFFFPCEKTWL